MNMLPFIFQGLGNMCLERDVSMLQDADKASFNVVSIMSAVYRDDLLMRRVRAYVCACVSASMSMSACVSWFSCLSQCL